jgi:poly(A) polymerase
LLWEFILRVLEVLGGPTWPVPSALSFPLAFAALLHSVPLEDGAGAICRRLRLSNDETDRVSWLIDEGHSLLAAPTLRPSRLFPLLVQPGVGELIALYRAEAVAAGETIHHIEFCERLLRETPPDVLDPPPLLTGHDLHQLGLKPGPEFRRILAIVRESQLDAEVRSREEALKLVETLLQPRPGP